MTPSWIEFDPAASGLPSERRHVLLLVSDAGRDGCPPTVAVGYLRIHSGGPFFVVPGVAHTKVSHWADCLGDDFYTPVVLNKHGQRWQLTNGKWGEVPPPSEVSGPGNTDPRCLSDTDLVDTLLSVYARSCTYGTRNLHDRWVELRAEVWRRLAYNPPDGG